jgi:hypothetical protein
MSKQPQAFAGANEEHARKLSPGRLAQKGLRQLWCSAVMGSLIKKRRKRMRKKKHRKMLKATRFQRRAAGK